MLNTDLLIAVQTLRLGAELGETYIKSVPGAGGQADAVHMLWIVQEYCDRSTLADAGMDGHRF
jgi:hypothetical protein